MSPFFTDQGVVFCSSCGAMAESDPAAPTKLACPRGHDDVQLEVDAGATSAQAALPDDAIGDEHDHAPIPPEPEA